MLFTYKNNNTIYIQFKIKKRHVSGDIYIYIKILKVKYDFEKRYINI